MTIQRVTDRPSEAAPRPAILVRNANSFLATEDAAGPWSPSHCHGGVPAALITRIAEQTPSLVPMEVARLSIELLRPVPTTELTARTEIVREGKKLQLVSIDIEADGVVVARGSVLKLRAAAQAVDPHLLVIDHDIQSPEDLPLDQPMA